MSIAMSAAQAYCGAICNALGVYIHEFPITPDKILKAIEEKKKQEQKGDKTQAPESRRLIQICLAVKTSTNAKKLLGWDFGY